MVNGWTFEETIKTTKNLMETESNMFKWDVLRHLRDFAENFKDRIQQFEAIGTIDEFKALKEKNTPKKRGIWKSGHTCCPNCERGVVTEDRFCSYCGQALKPKET